LNAYLLAGKTEFWRAHRKYAGVLHFVYLTCSYPGVYTSDHFLDVKTLKLDPHFADYLGEAFKPLGVYINFFQPALKPGQPREFTVMMVNDEPRAVHGRLTLSLEKKSGEKLAAAEQGFSLPEWGAETQRMSLAVPDTEGECILKATARSEGKGSEATVSRRWVTLR
jgi:hypothetical protein